MPKTKPSEYLVVAQGGKLINHGPAATVLLRPGAIWLKVPATQLETEFGMTQETRDGIPLRFKGNVVFRIVRPEITALRFDFSAENGVAAMSAQIQETVLAELRDVVSHLTMQDCIEQRKTTLSGNVRQALDSLVMHPDNDWGILLESVQVAQVFIVDQDLRRQLEAETRSQIKSESELAGMKASETVNMASMKTSENIDLAKMVSVRRVGQESVETERQKIQQDQEISRLREEAEQAKKASELASKESLDLARIVSARRVQSESLETDRQRIAREQEIFRLENEATMTRLEAEAPVKLRQVQDDIELARARKELLELECEVHRLEMDRELYRDRAVHAMKMESLPIEQLPAMAAAATGMFQGSNLSLYGGETSLLAGVEPLLQMMGRTLRGQNRNSEENKV